MISFSGQQLIGQLCALAGMSFAGCVCLQSYRTWQRQQLLQDLSVLVLAGAWLAYLVIMTGIKEVSVRSSTGQAQGFVAQVYVEHIGLQLLAVAVSGFLLLTTGIAWGWVYVMLTVQALFGLAVLSWRPWDLANTFTNFAASSAYPLWVVPNLCGATATTAVILRAAWRTRSAANWLAFSGCLMGLALCADQLLVGDKSVRTATMSQLAFALFLWVVWRITANQSRTVAPRAGALAEFPQSGNMTLLSDFGSLPNAASAALAAVAQERRRIGQDLHDGVASQLVTLLSTLDSALPKDQRMALALEKCLVDLKMTVDALDASTDNILDALGRLRYRVQHSLDKLGIQMLWRVEVRDELAAVRGDAALHTLRIAQESLSNVMVHAQASAVEVVCRYLTETDTLLLEVRDNGCGIARHRGAASGSAGQTELSGFIGTPPSGKGLINMRNRAKSMGGQLTISSKLGAGTRVRLQLPVRGAARLVERSEANDLVVGSAGPTSSLIC